MPDQIAGAGARLGKGLDATAAKVWDQRHHGGPWCGVEIGRTTFEVAALAHHHASSVALSEIAGAAAHFRNEGIARPASMGGLDVRGVA